METTEQTIIDPIYASQPIKQDSQIEHTTDEYVPEIGELNGKIHTIEPLKENNMNHQNISIQSSLNSSTDNVEKLLKSISILKNANDEILTTVVDRILLAEDNVTKLMKDNDNLRQLLQEMHDHEPKMKEELLAAVKVKEANFNKILQQKELEYEQLRQAYEDVSERGGSNQEVTKLQTKLKFVETKLKSVQTQLDNKTKENEELSNMMNELCGQQV